MSQASDLDQDCGSATAGREAGSTANDLGLSEASRADLHGVLAVRPETHRERPVHSCSRANWKNAFFGAVALLFLAVVSYAAVDVKIMKRRALSGFKKIRD